MSVHKAGKAYNEGSNLMVSITYSFQNDSKDIVVHDFFNLFVSVINCVNRITFVVHYMAKNAVMIFLT